LVLRSLYIQAFQSTPSGGKATQVRPRASPARLSFNPRLPGGRRHQRLQRRDLRPRVSIHAFRGEGDEYAETRWHARPGFQSTPSGGKATWCPQPNKYTLGSVSIHAFRGEGDSTPERTQ